MHIGKGRVTGDYWMDGTKLQRVSELKDLGVVITDTLKPSQQCMQANGDVNKMMALIKRTVVNNKRGIMLSLYNSLVRPHLEYCTAAWSPYLEESRKGLTPVYQDRSVLEEYALRTKTPEFESVVLGKQKR